MKQILTLGLLLISICRLIAQDFASIGAKWYYTEVYFMTGDIGFITAEVLKDTIIHNKECRMIENGILCGAFEQVQNFVYEEDSTVYFYVQEIDSFQILYDFGANQGDHWNITFDAMSELVTLQATVDTVYYVNINGHSLIRQIIKYGRPDSDPNDYSYYAEVTEIIGDSYFLFNLYSLDIVCDGNWSGGLRCYEDPEFGFYSTGIAESCTYTYDWTMIDQRSIENNFKIFPNPSTGKLQINFIPGKSSTLEIFDLMGRIVYSIDFVASVQIDLAGFSNGMYIVSLKYQDISLGMKKIIKI